MTNNYTDEDDVKAILDAVLDPFDAMGMDEWFAENVDSNKNAMQRCWQASEAETMRILDTIADRIAARVRAEQMQRDVAACKALIDCWIDKTELCEEHSPIYGAEECIEEIERRFNEPTPPKEQDDA